MIPTITTLCGDWVEQLRTLPDQSVHCCVTSPPYWGLRDYGVAGQLGLEKTPDCGRQGLMRLRSDLTEVQREYVVRRLLGAADRDAQNGGKDDKA